MYDKPISQLLTDKSICILCPTESDNYRLFGYLSEWRDLEWKSGRKITCASREWYQWRKKTVFFLSARSEKNLRGKKYYLLYSDYCDLDIPRSHTFTVDGFISYIVQQGANSVFQYVLE